MIRLPGDGRQQDVRSRKRDWTRAEILAEAWELARAEGVAALSLRELAARVGMRAPSLYTYFPSKNDLYDAMYAQGMRQFAEVMGSSPPGRTSQETLRNRARIFVGAAVQDPFRFELLFERPIPAFVPSAESLAIGLACLAPTRDVAEAAGLRGQRAFDLFMATMRGLVGMQIANEPGGDRWVGLVDEAVDILVAHYAREAGSAPAAGERGSQAQLSGGRQLRRLKLKERRRELHERRTTDTREDLAARQRDQGCWDPGRGRKPRPVRVP